jgi:Ni/Fe-hydrogenase b-type cytochrome subunit
MAVHGLQRRHSLAVRVMHWVNALAFVLLLMSGLQIFNAHPALYWGQSSYSGRPPLLQIEGFPGWITIPGEQWLAMGRRWHLFFAWVLVVNGLAYLVYTIASRHLARDLVPTAPDWRGIGRSIADHLRLRHPVGAAAARYNVLQQAAYLAVIFVLLPLMAITGWAMSPGLDSVVPHWVDLLGGRQSARTIHFICAWTLVAFLAVHVFEVAATGLWNNLRSMITGRYRLPAEPRDGRDA